MTTEHRDYKTPTGIIHYGPAACRDNYPNIRIYDQPPKGGSPVKLQAAALRAFQQAERDYGKATKRPAGWRAIVLTGSWRSCAYQAELYRSDSSRYAHPNVTGHPRGIAIDVSTNQPNQDIIARCLRRNGWTQTRPDGEPWHWSIGVTV